MAREMKADERMRIEMRDGEEGLDLKQRRESIPTAAEPLADGFDCLFESAEQVSVGPIKKKCLYQPTKFSQVLESSNICESA